MAQLKEGSVIKKASGNELIATKEEVDAKIAEKVKTDVPAGAKFTDTVYTHPASHSASMITGLPTSLPANGGNADTVDGFSVGISVPTNAKFTDTIYTHPSLHPASIITESTTKKFVSDTEKANWNNKWDYNESTVKAVKVNSAGNADTVNGKTIAENVPAGAKFTDTVYSHPTTAGNKHIPTGGASGQVLKYSASGTATWQADNDTVTSINGKTGVIVKTDITALGIPAQDTVYTHPTTAGNKHLPTAGATSNFLIYGGASGTASWSAMSDTLHGTRGGGTQHSVATTSANGFMSGTDKTKLDGIDAGANKITLGITQPTSGWWFKEIT